MSFTISDLEKLNKAIASGTLEITSSSGKRLRYQTVGDLIKARDLVRSELIANGLLSSGNTNRGPASLAVFSRD